MVKGGNSKGRFEHGYNSPIYILDDSTWILDRKWSIVVCFKSLEEVGITS